MRDISRNQQVLNNHCKYQAGWFVKIRNDLLVGQTYNKLPFLKEMENLKGKYFEIEATHYTCLLKRYFLKGIVYEFSEEMLEFPNLEDLEDYKKRTLEKLNEEIKQVKKF